MLDAGGKAMQASSFAVTTVHAARTLAVIRLGHTVVWALIVACIVAIPAAAWAGHFRLAAILSGLVWGECGVLAFNHGRCPLTNLAERFTAEKSANFDIYLPEWVARRNKEIFGTLFMVNELIALILWVRKG